MMRLCTAQELDGCQPTLYLITHDKYQLNIYASEVDREVPLMNASENGPNAIPSIASTPSRSDPVLMRAKMPAWFAISVSCLGL